MQITGTLQFPPAGASNPAASLTTGNTTYRLVDPIRFSQAGGNYMAAAAATYADLSQAFRNGAIIVANGSQPDPNWNWFLGTVSPATH